MKTFDELAQHFCYLGEIKQMGPKSWQEETDYPFYEENRKLLDEACFEWLSLRGYDIRLTCPACEHDRLIKAGYVVAAVAYQHTCHRT